MSADRVISLLPAATEIVCALGLENKLVGRSHECDYPETVKQLLVCSYDRIGTQLTSLEIDQKVKQLLTNVLSVYEVNSQLIKQLSPDMIITQDQCAACAVSLPEVEQVLSAELEKPAQIISLQPNSLNGILDNIREVAIALNVVNVGDELLEELQERIDIIQHKLRFIEKKPAVACIEWLEPLMTSGNWVPELVTIAGGTPVLSQAGKHSPYINWDDLREQDPEIIVVMACGFSVERTLKEISTLLQLPGFADLQAIKNQRFYIADGNQYFNRPGPRIVDSIEILAEIINPKQFIFGYEGEGWIKFEV
ncbi:cobalamin-binding protein [Mucilaginibacter sp. CSA2-8R]|uniref:cobalamin-binding protein n=1 Tax=Mucilaginibacter sp. CSA2-8R TaxID=3141542 RepID=UPI00315C682F